MQCIHTVVTYQSLILSSTEDIECIKCSASRTKDPNSEVCHPRNTSDSSIPGPELIVGGTGVLVVRAGNEPSQRLKFHNYREGPD